MLVQIGAVLDPAGGVAPGRASLTASNAGVRGSGECSRNPDRLLAKKFSKMVHLGDAPPLRRAYAVIVTRGSKEHCLREEEEMGPKSLAVSRHRRHAHAVSRRRKHTSLRRPSKYQGTAEASFGETSDPAPGQYGADRPLVRVSGRTRLNSKLCAP